MANVREVLRRIKSGRNIQQITRAMKMIAAARIKKTERALKFKRKHLGNLIDLKNEIISQLEDPEHPLLSPGKSGSIGLLVVAGDKGLCGAYNMNVIKASERFIKKSKLPVKLYIVGGKAYKYLIRKTYSIEKSYAPWEPKDSLAEEIAQFLITEFQTGKITELHCIYTQSISLLIQRLAEEKILPVGFDKNKISGVNYLFEPEPLKTLDIFLPIFVKDTILRILLEARASELAARVNAMSNATDNAEKFVNELQLKYYRARQDSITTEILEIASGAAQLKKG